MQKTLSVVVGLLLCLSLNGCVRPCDQIALHQHNFRTEIAQPVQAPHLVAAMPFSVVNELIEPQVRSWQPMPLEIPGGGILAPFLTDFTLQPRNVRIIPAQGRGLGIELVLSVTQGNEDLFDLTVQGVIQPRLSPETGTVEVVLSAADFQSMEPRISPDAVARLTEFFDGFIPAVARLVISPQAIASGAALVAQIIIQTSYPLLRDQIFSRLGPLARVEVSLPDLPLQRIEFSTRGTDETNGMLILEAYSNLPIRSGVEVEDLRFRPGSDVVLSLSGDAVARIANWSMARGQLPSRFDSRGQAQETGEFEAALAWESGSERPLHVHVWRLQPASQCLRAILSARPDLRVVGDQIELEVQDPRIEELEGPPMAGIARLFARIWLRAMERTQSTAASLEFTIASNPFRGRLTSAHLDGDTINLSMVLEDR